MRIKTEFTTHLLGESQLVMFDEYKGFVRSNDTAAFIIELLKEDRTKEEIISILLEKYNVDRKIIEEDVEKVIDALDKAGLIYND